MASPVIADPFHRMKYMERHGSGLRKIVRETEKPPGYTAAYNPEIFSTATDFRVILKNANYQLSQKNLVNDQVSEQDKSPDIPHTVLNLCIHLIAHGSEGVQITHAHSIMGTANDKSYDATHCPDAGYYPQHWFRWVPGGSSRLSATPDTLSGNCQMSVPS